MPPRKEAKEPIVYPASKRKAPPFKPLRPSKFARPTSTGSSNRALSQPRRVHSAPIGRKAPAAEIIEDDDDDDDDQPVLATSKGKKKDKTEGLGSDDDSEEELALDPRAAPKAKKPTSKSLPTKTKTTQPTKALSISSRASSPGLNPWSSPDTGAASIRRENANNRSSPIPDNDGIPMPSQALLLRLLHESFAEKSTRIDKHAIQVLQKYVEVFVREAIARTAQLKEEKADKGLTSWDDRAWLEVEDLEEIVAGLVLDF